MDWKLTVVAGRDALGRTTADVIVDQMASNPTTALALPTGRTPLPVYDRLKNANRDDRVSFSGAHIFQLDEFYPISPEHPGSFRRFLEREFVEGVDVDRTHLHFFDGEADDPEEECARIEAEIAELGGLDMALVGIGENGHIAFNEPGTPFDVRTHVVELDSESRKALTYLFASLDEVPQRALTLGLGTIMDARRIVLIASGSRKAEVVRDALERPISPDTPASVLRKHEDLVIILDREAAALLSSATTETDTL